MPLLNLYLLSLSTSLPKFLSTFRASVKSNDVVVISKPRFLYIPATSLDAQIVNETRWDILLLLHRNVELGGECCAVIEKEYRLTVGVPGKLLAGYPEHNRRLLRDATHVELTGALDKALKGRKGAAGSGEDLELSEGIIGFMEQMAIAGEADRPVSMLNLLRFKDGGRESYIKYGQGFKEAGGRRGGDAKIVGAVVKEGAKADSWDEIAFVHYPSIRHFCDMTAGEDYQEINHKHRLAALGDTVLLCTTEIDTLGQWGYTKL